MKQSARSLTYTGLAGAVAFAGASQAYGTVVNVAAPANIPGHAASTAGSTKVYWDVDTGKSSTTSFTGADIEFGYYNNSSTNEFFTGVYVLNGGGGVTSYYASNATNYGYGVTKGASIGTGGAYATFGQKAGYFSILALSYKGAAYAIMKTDVKYYLGFQYTGADGFKHDGWITLESDVTGGLTFFNAAYNNASDAAGNIITAGQLGTNAVPEPGTLAALAIGATALAGVGIKRRRKAALADQVA